MVGTAGFEPTTSTVVKVAQASSRGPVELGPPVAWRKNRLPLAPDASDFAYAAGWAIKLPPFPRQPSLSDVFVRISYNGDVARLSHGEELLDDNFWNGTPWMVGLHTLSDSWQTAHNPLQLKVLARPEGISMFLEDSARVHTGSGATLQGVVLLPQYRLDVHLGTSPDTK